MRRAAISVAVVIALGGLACSASPEGAPADAVTRLFAAVESGSCSGVLAELGAGYRAELEREGIGCNELIEQMRTYPFEVVLDTRVDGRNAAAHLVHARMRGREQPVVIRVQAEDGQWRIMAL
jgi:hypothetical protein